MSTANKPHGRADTALAGAGIVMVLCCAVGPAVIGAVAGGAIGGWPGIACAVVVAAAVGLFLHRRTRERGGC